MTSPKQSVDEYLEKSDKLITHVEEIKDDNPQKALAMAAEQLEEHINFLQRVVSS